MDLSKVLADLRAAGVTRGRYTVTEADGKVHAVEVQFGPDLQPVTGGLVDREGKPVNLDAGNPWGEDPLEEKYRPTKRKEAS